MKINEIWHDNQLTIIVSVLVLAYIGWQWYKNRDTKKKEELVVPTPNYVQPPQTTTTAFSPTPPQTNHTDFVQYQKDKLTADIQMLEAKINKKRIQLEEMRKRLVFYEHEIERQKQ